MEDLNSPNFTIEEFINIKNKFVNKENQSKDKLTEMLKKNRQCN